MRPPGSSRSSPNFTLPVAEGYALRSCHFMKSIRRMGHTRTEIGIPLPPPGRKEAYGASGMHGTRRRPPSLRRPPLCNGANEKCVLPTQGETGQGKNSLEGENYRGENVLAAGLVLARSRGLNGNDRETCLKRGRIPPCVPRAAAQCTPCIAGCESRHGITHEDPPFHNGAASGPKLRSLQNSL